MDQKEPYSFIEPLCIIKYLGVLKEILSKEQFIQDWDTYKVSRVYTHFIYFDINEMSNMNFMFGFEYGDSVLSLFADQISFIFGSQLVYRWDSDEFIGLVSKSNHPDHLIKELSKNIKRLNSNISFKSITLEFNGSIDSKFQTIRNELLKLKR